MKLIFFLLFLGLVIMIPKLIDADINSNQLIVSSGNTIWNVTSSTPIYSMNILDDGLIIQATSNAEEKTYKWYKSQSNDVITVSLISINKNNVNFTINNEPTNDIKLSLSGSKVLNLYLNGVVSNDNIDYSSGVNTLNIGATRNVMIEFIGSLQPPSSGGGATTTQTGGVPEQPIAIKQVTINADKPILTTHKLSQQNGKITMTWDASDDLKIYSVYPEEKQTWFGFQTTPVILKGDESGKSSQSIGFVVNVPDNYCIDVLSTLCNDQKTFVVPITIKGEYNNVIFTTLTEVVINVEPQGFVIPQINFEKDLPIILTVAGILTVFLYYLKEHKYKKPVEVISRNNKTIQIERERKNYEIKQERKILEIKKLNQKLQVKTNKNNLMIQKLNKIYSIKKNNKELKINRNNSAFSTKNLRPKKKNLKL